MFKQLAVIIFGSLLLQGCIQQSAWVQPNISEGNSTDIETINAPISTNLILLYIDDGGPYWHGFFTKYDRYRLSPGYHTMGIFYRRDDSTSSTYSQSVVGIGFTLEPKEEYEAVAVIQDNKWIPIIRNVKSREIISRPTGAQYPNP